MGSCMAAQTNYGLVFGFLWLVSCFSIDHMFIEAIRYVLKYSPLCGLGRQSFCGSLVESSLTQTMKFPSFFFFFSQVRGE